VNNFLKKQTVDNVNVSSQNGVRFRPVVQQQQQQIIRTDIPQSFIQNEYRPQLTTFSNISTINGVSNKANT
jgi:hypothetical protein